MHFYINNNYYIIKRKFFFKQLILKKKNLSGRSNFGNLIFFGRGGSKYHRFYLLIDFKRLIFNLPALILHFEYDPNRNSFIMLVLYFNGVLTYLLALNLLNKYMIIMTTFSSTLLLNGYVTTIFNCLNGSFLNCIKLKSLIAKVSRSAGTYVQLVRKFGNYSLLRFPSKEECFITSDTLITLGRVSNDFVKLMKYSSAGILRRFGWKSTVRGTAKNPIDHPHGGAGRTPTGKPSVSYWGLYTKGLRTTTRFKRFTLLKFGFYKRRSKHLF